MNIIVSTPHRDTGSDALLREFLEESGFAFYPRERRSLEKLARDYAADAVIIWQEEGPILYHGAEKFFFHPSVSRVRLGACRKLHTVDPLVKACQFEPDFSFLDCTIGLGADSIVAAYFLPRGRVVGLESAPGIAQVVKWGMKMYQADSEWLQEAVRRVQIINCDHYTYLKDLPDNAFDIVYFDPMFRRPVLESAAISPLRSLANHEPLSLEVIAEARRVARHRVVVKERHGSSEFERLGIDNIVGGHHSTLAYGVITTGPDLPKGGQASWAE
ncbi:MAG: class I SAM-dependent methyltransferase [Syntrophomonadaceae bacterium]